MEKNQANPQEIQIQGVIDSFLRAKNSKNNFATHARHLDEDSLAVFAEGNLSERESAPIVRHLVECSFCRRVTADLVRLDLAFADQEIQTTAAESQPSKISEVLNNLFSRILGTSGAEVFAHQEKEENAEEKKDAEDEI